MRHQAPTQLLESRLVDLILDLHGMYGVSNPRPSRGGTIVNFHVVHNSTTYQKAKSEIEALLLLHGVKPMQLAITPGPEQLGKVNRSITFSIGNGVLI